MANGKSAWGIEIGANAIKAIRLERDGDEVTVADFAVIPHKKVLSTPDLDQDEMIRLGLGQFISQKSLEDETLVLSVPGHAAFARFAKLPPVEPKKVPDIVKFEAVQQIPFPIEEVEWDYQTFTSEDSPEVEVGIFAMTRDRVQQRLSLYAELGITPDSLNLSPVAVYNAMAYDLANTQHDEAVIYLDIGTNATDLTVVQNGRCWIRTFPLGGTHFTEAIVDAFKLSYTKAEKLKHEAATSKYAKQILQAMRPVFSDLLQEVQRSLTHYQATHRDTELDTMVGLGSTFKLPGLRKFLGQQLQMKVVRLDEYQRIAVTGREAASFAENAVNMATAYGLALQGVGLANIDANLVPTDTLREQLWHAKTKWFAAAAAIVVIGACMTFYRPLTDQGKVESVEPVVDATINLGRQNNQQFTTAAAAGQIGEDARNIVDLAAHRRIMAYLLTDAASALASADPQPELLGDDPALIYEVPPEERRLVQLRRLTTKDRNYVPAGVDSTTGAATPERRTMTVEMYVEVTHRDYVEFLNGTVAKWLRDTADMDRPDVPYKIIRSSISLNQYLAEHGTYTEEGETALASTGTGNSGTGGGGVFGAGGNSGGAAAPSDPGVVQGSGGSGMLRRNTRDPNAPKRSAGGSGVGAAGGPGGGNTPPPAVDPGSSGTGVVKRNDPNRNRSERSAPSAAELFGLAPMPSAPRLYPAGARWHRVYITFDVELTEGQVDTVTSPTASASSDDEETAS